ncbi:MAG: hypothetical protein DI570_16470 [Phenylobacterium zucineum]|nr:MAG: hypothetical protein DI570_16470 [Phenylobacterium zucineum]
MSTPSVTEHPATCYTVRNGWAWAHIFVRHGTSKGELSTGGDRHWVHVSVLSDFGEFGYCWSHIGEDWRKFLANLDLHYAMNKMLGPRFRVPLGIEEADAKGRQLILQGRRENNLTTEDARKLWDGLKEAETDEGLDHFLRDWDRGSGGLWYAQQWWDYRWDKVNPQAEGFWEKVWPHFVAHLTEQPVEVVA